MTQRERDFIKQRQAEGIAAAKLRGVHCGRPPMQRPPQWERALRELRAGECSLREAAFYCGISHSTVRRWMREAKE